jgi:hypothetical protein
MNLWKRLNEITGQREPVFVGEVIGIDSTFGDVRCTMTILPGAETLEVLAPGRVLEIGQRWVVQGGRIIAEAPTTEVLEIEI